MKTNAVIFVLGFLLALTVGYFFFTKDTPPPVEEETVVSQTEEESEPEVDADDLASTIPEEAEALSRNGCLSCHSVESIDAIGGNSGPDLSKAFKEAQDKHGVTLDEFLQEPTSAVMSTVIGDNPLDAEEREQIIEALKKAAEAN